MKSRLFIFALLSIIPFISYAQEPLLNETFEKFEVSSFQQFVEIPSGLKWVGNGASVAIVANPNKSGINTSNLVMQLKREANPGIVEGAEGNLRPDGNGYKGCLTYSYGLNLDDNLCVIEVKVLTKISGKVGIRIYPDISKKTYSEIVVKTKASDEWQLVRFDFTGKIPSDISNSKFLFEIDKILTAESQSTEMTMCIDDIKLIAK
ncbi:MAG: hypothetical protein ACOYOT_00085 [Bacteroidales bacterium]